MPSFLISGLLPPEARMAVTIRKMTTDDLLEAKGVDLLCWNDLLERSYAKRARLSKRTDENLRSCIHADPEGAFVASESNSGIVGTCFSHIWGRTGWVGPLSVLPTFQDQGIGKELLKRALRHLEDARCSDIGLETMPENATNLGMYLKVGLRPEGLIVVLRRGLDRRYLDEEPSGDVSVELFSESSIKEHFKAEIGRISSIIRAGLDYSSEIELAQKFSLGDTIIATGDGKVVGFSLLHTSPRRVGSSDATIKILAIDPMSRLETEALQPLLVSSELLAADEGMEELSVAVPSSCRRVVDYLLSRGYNVARTFERLIWTGGSGMEEKVINLCSWSA